MLGKEFWNRNFLFCSKKRGRSDNKELEYENNIFKAKKTSFYDKNKINIINSELLKDFTPFSINNFDKILFQTNPIKKLPKKIKFESPAYIPKKTNYYSEISIEKNTNLVDKEYNKFQSYIKNLPKSNNKLEIEDKSINDDENNEIYNSEKMVYNEEIDNNIPSIKPYRNINNNETNIIYKQDKLNESKLKENEEEKKQYYELLEYIKYKNDLKNFPTFDFELFKYYNH